MSKKIMKYIIIFAIVILVFCTGTIIYSFASSNKKNDSGNIYEKIDSEIEYLQTHLLSVINGLNNLNTEYLITNNEVQNNNNQNNTTSGGTGTSSGSAASGNSAGGSGAGASSNSSQSNNDNQGDTSANILVSTITTESIMSIDRNNIDWTYIQKEVEKISNSWSIATIDLNSIGVPNNDILAFNDNMDNAFKYIKNKDKQNSLISTANLYSLLSKYKDSYSDNNKEKELLHIKSDIISSYALLDTGKWDNIYSTLGDADKRLLGLINSPDSDAELQKAYIILKELIKAANNKDVDVCYMKYFYLIKELKS